MAVATAKKLQSLEDQMRALALAIDSSYARTGFSPDNIRINRDFDALEALYNSTSTSSATTQQQKSRIIRSAGGTDRSVETELVDRVDLHLNYT